MSFFGSLWKGIKSVGKSIGNFFTGGNSGSSISALAGLGSSALNYASTSKGLKEQFNYNKALQANAQQWSTGMAASAHQLEVNDMRKAGLNPILSATGGSGASAPGATGGSVGLPNYNLGEGLSTALSYRQQKNQDKIVKEQVDNLKADSYLKGNQAETESERFNTQISQTNLFKKQIDDLENQIKNRDKTTAASIERMKTQNLADIINAQANREVSSANAWYNRHRALGFTDSYSTSDSYSNGSLGPTNWLPSKGGTSTYSHSRTR